MATDNRESRTPLEVLAERLVVETGITESQAQELVAFLGANWSSLVREAKLLEPAKT
jgi:hypothetical protein